VRVPSNPRRGVRRPGMSRLAQAGLLVVVVLAGPGSALLSAPTGASTAKNVAGEPGYRMLAADGGVFSFGAPFLGAPASDPTRCVRNPDARSMPYGSCWSMASTPDGGGYYVLDAFSGQIYPYGDAVSYGQPADTGAYQGGADLWPNALAMAVTPDGKGYWVLELGLSGMASVQAFGDAAFYGDPATSRLETKGVPEGIVGTADGKGYWIAFSDGGVFSYGDAQFYGSMGGHTLAAGVVGMARTADGNGYWLAGADGGVFAFGDAAYEGSVAGLPLAAPVVGIAADPAGPGYWLGAADGGVFALGGAPFEGSMAGHWLASPVGAITSAAALPPA